MEKKPTVIHFLGTHTVIFFAMTLIGMCALFMFTLYQAELDTARGEVARESRHASQHIMMYDNGTVYIDSNFNPNVEGCRVAVVTGDGGVISGILPIHQRLAVTSQPPDKDQNPAGREKSGGLSAGKKRTGSGFRIIKENGNEYYVFDSKIDFAHSESGSIEKLYGNPLVGNYYVRAVLSENDHRSVYHEIQIMFFTFVIIMILIAVIGRIWLYRKVAYPMKKMCENVSRVSYDPDYSERIDRKVMFYETEVMKNAYNSLMDRNETLRHLQEEFNENVSHELRTPVAVIRSESDLIRDLYQDKVPEEVTDAANVIHKETERINAMISELMYLAKMDRENFALKKESMELSDIAESVCEDIEEEMPGRHTFKYRWDPAEAEIDVDLIMIAVRNLIMNAVKYSPDGSEIELYSGIKGDSAILCVRDHGIGISKENLDRIFDPYYQVKSERNSEGFGLGLALTMKIAKKHGGTVLVDSVEGEGSTFTLMVPIK